MKTVPSCYDWADLYPQVADEPKQILNRQPNFAVFRAFVITGFEGVITNCIFSIRSAAFGPFAGHDGPPIDVLVATTVIEVGVDVPDATVMVIEHAERFGLAQLHQLRGRIGRGERDATCLLLYGREIGATGRERLRVLRETDDGFEIAEQDLRLRGAGDVLGTRQSGLPEFRLVDLEAHGGLLAVARDDARLIMEGDPGLETARGDALRTLLYLFERDAAVRYARAG